MVPATIGTPDAAGGDGPPAAPVHAGFARTDILDRLRICRHRPWRTVKYGYLYLHAFEGGGALRWGLRSWVEWYNRERPHQILGYRTPDEMYYGELEPLSEVA